MRPTLAPFRVSGRVPPAPADHRPRQLENLRPRPARKVAAPATRRGERCRERDQSGRSVADER